MQKIINMLHNNKICQYNYMVNFGRNGIIVVKGVISMDSYTYTGNEIIYLPVKKILPNPYQPRHSFDKKSMDELTQSIKQYGILQPITVRYINKKIYELVNGERRLTAAKLAGLESIPAIIIYANDREAAAMAITENLQRKNLNYLEEAESMRILKYGFKYSLKDISHIVNKDERYIEDSLKFLDFSKEIKRLLIKNNISRNAATALLKTDDEDIQKDIIEKISELKLDDNTVMRLVGNAVRIKKLNNSKDKDYVNLYSKFKDIRLFTNTLRQALSYVKAAGLETSYIINKDDDNYEIRININSNNSSAS